MTDEPELESEGLEMSITSEVGQAPFWMAFMLPNNRVDDVLLRAWIFDRVHTTSDVAANISTISYMEMVARWISMGVQEQVSLKVVVNNKTSPAGD